MDYEKNATEYKIVVVVGDPHGGRADTNFTAKLLNVVEDFDEDGGKVTTTWMMIMMDFRCRWMAYGSDPLDSQSVINHAEDILMEGGEIEENQPLATIVARLKEWISIRIFPKLSITPQQEDEYPFRLSQTGELISKSYSIMRQMSIITPDRAGRDEHNTTCENRLLFIT